MSRHKYHAQPVIIDGIRYDSKTEAMWVCGRMMEVRAGALRNVMRQPRYTLGDIAYRADLEVCDNQGNVWAEDVKGVETQRFRLVRRLWPKYGPHPLHVIKRRGRRWFVEQIGGKTA